MPTAAEIFGDQADLSQLAGDPDEEGWEWVDVRFDRESAEDLARRYERSTLTEISEATGMQAQDVSGQVSTVAEVLSVRDVLALGGYAALGRAIAAVEMQLSMAVNLLALPGQSDSSSE